MTGAAALSALLRTSDEWLEKLEATGVPAPPAGEHTERVLRELECCDADIQRLGDAKIV